jgi:hypothetical protein
MDPFEIKTVFPLDLGVSPTCTLKNKETVAAGIFDGGIFENGYEKGQRNLTGVYILCIYICVEFRITADCSISVSLYAG